MTKPVPDKEQGKQFLWYVRRRNRVQGPFPSGSIRRFLLLGRVLLDDEVSLDKSDWRRLSEVPEVIPPEVRKALENGTVASVLPAQLREDERSGRDRREEKDRSDQQERRAHRARPRDTVLDHEDRVSVNGPDDGAARDRERRLVHAGERPRPGHHARPEREVGVAQDSVGGSEERAIVDEAVPEKIASVVSIGASGVSLCACPGRARSGAPAARYAARARPR